MYGIRPFGFSIAVLVLFSSLQSATAQRAGLGTPVITPPILDGTTQNGEQLVVPATPSAVPAEPQQPVQPAAAPAQVVAPVAPAPEVAPVVQVPETVSNPARSTDVKAVGDWSLECFTPAFEEGACQIVHRVVSGQGAQVVLVFSLAASTPDVPANIQIALPLGVALGSGVQLLIGSEYQNHVPLSRCTPQGCLIEGTVTSALLAAMRKEKTGTVVVVNEQGEQIRLPFSLVGFSDAYTQMIAANSAGTVK